MARTFQYTLDRRIINHLIRWLLELGLELDSYHLLAVAGRRSGKPHIVPVVIIEEGQKCWLTAPYGVVDWVKNARASGVITLRRGRHSQEYVLRELSPREAAPILRIYVGKFPITLPYFDATPSSDLEVFEAEARSRPVFELTAR